MNEKKTPKQLDPWRKVFVTIDYHYMHVYKTSEENTAPVSQATMYKKYTTHQLHSHL